jgi:hypothetical protein
MVRLLVYNRGDCTSVDPCTTRSAQDSSGPKGLFEGGTLSSSDSKTGVLLVHVPAGGPPNRLCFRFPTRTRKPMGPLGRDPRHPCPGQSRRGVALAGTQRSRHPRATVTEGPAISPAGVPGPNVRPSTPSVPGPRPCQTGRVRSCHCHSARRLGLQIKLDSIIMIPTGRHGKVRTLVVYPPGGRCPA